MTILKTTFWRPMEPSCLRTRTARTFITILVFFVSKVFFPISSNWFHNAIMLSCLGGRDDTLVRAPTSHPNDLGSTPERGGFTYWLSLLSVVVLAPTVYLQVFQFSSLRKTKILTLVEKKSHLVEFSSLNFPSSIIFISFSCKMIILFDVSIVFFIKKNLCLNCSLTPF